MQELPDDAAHPTGDDEHGSVGLFATCSVLLVESSKVRRATDRDPTGFDQSPAQPFVTRRQEPAMVDLAARAMGRGYYPGIAAELLRAIEARSRAQNQRGTD